jgi:hypothetical protein
MPVVSGNPFSPRLVAAVSPSLAVAGAKLGGVVDGGYSAPPLNPHHALLEDALPAGERLPV